MVRLEHLPGAGENVMERSQSIDGGYAKWTIVVRVEPPEVGEGEELLESQKAFANECSPDLFDGLFSHFNDVVHHCELSQGSYSAGVSAGGSHAPVVKSWRRTSSLSWPHLVAVSR